MHSMHCMHCMHSGADHRHTAREWREVASAAQTSGRGGRRSGKARGREGRREGKGGRAVCAKGDLAGVGEGDGVLHEREREGVEELLGNRVLVLPAPIEVIKTPKEPK